MKYKYVTRIDSVNTHGWYVRVHRQGVKYEKLFSDQKCGGKDWALIKALIFADESLERMNKDNPKKITPRIYRMKKKSRGYEYEFYEVAWSPEPYKRKKKAFSITSLGEEKARKKAESLANDISKKLNKR